MFRHIQALFKSILTHIENLLHPWHIQNPGIFLSQSIFRLYIHNNILKIFKKLNLGRLMQFWMRPSECALFHRCYLTSRVALRLSLTLYFRHTQAYSRLIQAYLVLLRYIKSPGIFRDILLQLYSGIFQTLHTMFRHSWTYTCILRNI